MTGTVHVKIQGLPEEIQRVADALETSFPGVFIWQDGGVTDESNLITVNGVGAPAHRACPKHG